jgi:hypothetical protein
VRAADASRPSSRDATALASGPVAPSGPTHDGHPTCTAAVDQVARLRDELLVHRNAAAR